MAHHLVDHLRRDALRRVDRHAIAGVDAGTLDVLHDPRDEHVHAVGDEVDLHLLAEEILVHQDRRLGRDVDGVGHVGEKLLLAIDDLHGTPAEDVGGAHQHRETDLARHLQRGIHGGDGAARGLRDV